MKWIDGKVCIITGAASGMGKEEIKNDPKSRMCDPKEIASLVLFLASNEFRFVNGSEFKIDNAQTVSGV